MDVALLQETDALLRGADGHRHTEHTADAGPDKVGIIEVCQRIAHHDGIHPSSLCRAQDGTQVTRLLHTLEDDDERRVKRESFVERGVWSEE